MCRLGRAAAAATGRTTEEIDFSDRPCLIAIYNPFPLIIRVRDLWNEFEPRLDFLYLSSSQWWTIVAVPAQKHQLAEKTALES